MSKSGIRFRVVIVTENDDYVLKSAVNGRHLYYINIMRTLRMSVTYAHDNYRRLLKYLLFKLYSLSFIRTRIRSLAENMINFLFYQYVVIFFLLVY